MATFNYARSKQTAERLIKRFGQSASLKLTTPGDGPAYNPGEPTVTTYPCTLAIFDYRNSERDGTLIRAGDKLVYLSTEGLSVTPETSDHLVIGGLDHSIVEVQPLSPAGTAVYFQVQVRR